MVGFTTPPKSEHELLVRADSLAGANLGELAAKVGRQVPSAPVHAKGFTGELLEVLLGATAGSRAEPDFPELGIELKTLPIGQNGYPTESTFVCSIELGRLADAEWVSSRVKKKLSRVLWFPVQGDRAIPLATRTLGTPFLWSPSTSEWELLSQDWELLAGLVAQGRTSEITGHLGQVLQVRPKAANGSSTRLAFDEDGSPYAEMPRGFYLRTAFTGSLLGTHFSALSPHAT
jgi:DNA mismatch repair protein MutH